MVRSLLPALFLTLVAATSPACNVTRVAAHFASPVLDAGTRAFESESDVAFAEAAGPGNLKLLEGLLLEAPENEELLLLASRGYSTYSFGFFDPRLEAANLEDPAAAPALVARMTTFNQRAFEYGRRALSPAMHGALEAGWEEFSATLARQGRREVPALFWTAYAWASLIQLDLDNPDLLGAFPRVEAMMARVVELDEGYYYGGAHLFFGVLAAQLPPGGGGDTARSASHFSRARELTGGRLLIVDVLEARYLAVRLQDGARYRTLLERALSAPADALPQARLANEIARQRALFYLAHVEDFVVEDVSGSETTPTGASAP